MLRRNNFPPRSFLSHKEIARTAKGRQGQSETVSRVNAPKRSSFFRVFSPGFAMISVACSPEFFNFLGRPAVKGNACQLAHSCWQAKGLIYRCIARTSDDRPAFLEFRSNWTCRNERAFRVQRVERPCYIIRQRAALAVQQRRRINASSIAAQLPLLLGWRIRSVAFKNETYKLPRRRAIAKRCTLNWNNFHRRTLHPPWLLIGFVKRELVTRHFDFLLGGYFRVASPC